MDQQSEQMTLDQNTPCSISQTPDSSYQVVEFFKTVPQNTFTVSTATDPKIAQLIAQRKDCEKMLKRSSSA